MRIAFIADGRAENFRRWVRFFQWQCDEVSLLSTAPCDAVEGSALYILPGITGTSDVLVKRSDEKVSQPRSMPLGKKLFWVAMGERSYRLWSLFKAMDSFPRMIAARRILNRIKPDVVVAFRTQNEGYIAAMAGIHPWMLFTQGSDFVYMADHSRLHAWLTRFTVRRADALMADCRRDLRLARHYGYHLHRPWLLSPGNGGVDLMVFGPGKPADQRDRCVVFPRGVAPYIRFDTLLCSISDLQRDSEYSDVCYKILVTPAVVPLVCSMIRRWRLNEKKIDVLPFMSQDKLAALLQRSAVIVSPSVTDGTPNSMLEAMACGAFPVMSDLESIREWVIHEQNGLLFKPDMPQDLTNCLKTALTDTKMRQRAQEQNVEIIRKRADYWRIMPDIRQFLISVSDRFEKNEKNSCT